MNEASYDRDWFEELCTIKVSFRRQLHNKIENHYIVNTQKDIDALYLYPNLKENNVILTNQLLDLQAKIQNDTAKPSFVKELWLKKIDELATYALILTAVSDSKYQQLQHNYDIIDKSFCKIFGEFDKDLFNLTLSEAKIRLCKNVQPVAGNLRFLWTSSNYQELSNHYTRSLFDKNSELLMEGEI
jgi:hypothetical protein